MSEGWNQEQRRKAEASRSFMLLASTQGETGSRSQVVLNAAVNIGVLWPNRRTDCCGGKHWQGKRQLPLIPAQWKAYLFCSTWRPKGILEHRDQCAGGFDLGLFHQQRTELLLSGFLLLKKSDISETWASGLSSCCCGSKNKTNST